MQAMQNMQLYAGPWKKGYWTEAAGAFRRLRVLVFAAILVGLEVVLSLLTIPIGGGALQIRFRFFAAGLSSLVSGPFVALLSGCAADLLSFFLLPTGPFFPGYTLTAMLSALVYALFFFRARLSVLRIAACKLAVNLGLNVMLNSVWRVLLYGDGDWGKYWPYVGASLVKNGILYLIEVLVLVLVFQLLLAPLARMGMVPPQPEKRIPVWGGRKRTGPQEQNDIT